MWNQLLPGMALRAWLAHSRLPVAQSATTSAEFPLAGSQTSARPLMPVMSSGASDSGSLGLSSGPSGSGSLGLSSGASGAFGPSSGASGSGSLGRQRTLLEELATVVGEDGQLGVAQGEHLSKKRKHPRMTANFTSSG